MSEPGTRRVVVTGLGAVSSAGIGAAEFTAAIRAGAPTTSEISSFDTTGFPHVHAGEVKDFEPREWLRRIDPGQWGRSSQFAASAARLAVADAGLAEEDLAAARAGSVMGTTSGESAVIEELVAEWAADSLKSMTPGRVAAAPAGRIAAAVNHELGLTGEALTLATACSASNYALGYAYDMVAGGDADYMLAGGADSLNRWAHAGFFRLGALAEEVCRPFDVDRSGILTAEGGVALLLEPYERAVARGARMYAEVLGYSVNCDAEHMVHPDPTSIAACIRDAHRNAGVTPEQIDYICAHGTGTRTNDATEVAAAREVFGDRIPPISSIKSIIGHTMGAASGFGALICCQALYEGFLPPTANVEQVDPALGAGVDPVPGSARPARPQVVENHGFAFGGNNAITILGRVS
ncbi:MULTISPECIES: beta-ketoacyl-[acyl-carrier-protein] synthase family protein [Streptomyces]|uniref:beta-ketoacyl-[acyl-carrier-protein] synthase family protein n=1 Tax=Streptomyces TaxID=1883 RepID=UPI0004C277DF|nr:MULTISPECIES: beta-ketoacyl-[acyl-carrier-protein] synthase family protein [Streptomyces]KJY48066.1 3-oxoacyl-ACP synthase [Streptomyces sp. NRRL S-444]THA29728.1 beta-ketoacyl-[acyl-carrier-protein] synthase family protein [Streptomyces sp. A1547]WSN54225.1 beta-ketoacyl-[acyl-carrier-protein] synthase family protein [Streptomyces sp. NBC_01296]